MTLQVANMFDGVKGMPAKVCLGLSALIMFVYALNLIFFADCYTTNGAGASVDMESGVWTASGACFALFSNNAATDHENFGRGAEALQLAGTLMLGLFLGNMLILNEGAKGKWSLMIPGLIGFGVMLIIMVMGMDELPSKMSVGQTLRSRRRFGFARGWRDRVGRVHFFDPARRRLRRRREAVQAECHFHQRNHGERQRGFQHPY